MPAYCRIFRQTAAPASTAMSRNSAAKAPEFKTLKDGSVACLVCPRVRGELQKMESRYLQQHAKSSRHSQSCRLANSAPLQPSEALPNAFHQEDRAVPAPSNLIPVQASLCPATPSALQEAGKDKDLQVSEPVPDDMMEDIFRSLDDLLPASIDGEEGALLPLADLWQRAAPNRMFSLPYVDIFDQLAHAGLGQSAAFHPTPTDDREEYVLANEDVPLKPNGDEGDPDSFDERTYPWPSAAVSTSLILL